MKADTVQQRPLSISQLQRFFRCSYSWALAYQNKVERQVSASMWFGRIVHTIIALMYRNISMAAAIQNVWTSECGEVESFTHLVVLDAEYAAQGRTTTNVAKKWREQHPEYDALLSRIASIQETRLRHLRWGKTHSLADYYRRLIALLPCEDTLLMPNPVLVEGLPLNNEWPHTSESVYSDEDDKHTNGRLIGTIGGVLVTGVPDILCPR